MYTAWKDSRVDNDDGRTAGYAAADLLSRSWFIEAVHHRTGRLLLEKGAPRFTPRYFIFYFPLVGWLVSALLLDFGIC